MNGIKQTFQTSNLFIGLIFAANSAIIFKLGIDQHSVLLQSGAISLLLLVLWKAIRSPGFIPFA